MIKETRFLHFPKCFFENFAAWQLVITSKLYLYNEKNIFAHTRFSSPPQITALIRFFINFISLHRSLEESHPQKSLKSFVRNVVVFSTNSNVAVVYLLRTSKQRNYDPSSFSPSVPSEKCTTLVFRTSLTNPRPSHYPRSLKCTSYITTFKAASRHQ